MHGSCVIMFSGVHLYCCVILCLCVPVHAVLSGDIVGGCVSIWYHHISLWWYGHSVCYEIVYAIIYRVYRRVPKFFIHSV